MPGVSRESIKKAVAGSLRAGQKAGYGKVQKALAAAGVSSKYKGTVMAYQARAAFQKLKEAGVLSARAARSGAASFMRAVKKSEAAAGPSKEQIAGRAKVLLRERLAEEEEKKQRITEALGGKKEEAAKGGAAATRPPAVRGTSIPAARGGAPSRGVSIPEERGGAAPTAPAGAEEGAGPSIPRSEEAKDLPLD